MRDDTSESRSGHHDRPATGSSALRDRDARETFHVCVRDDNDPCAEIVRSVAAITGADPVWLPPLVGTVDPEALRRLVGGDTDSAAGLCVTFTYADCRVSISDDGELTIEGPGGVTPGLLGV